MATRNNITPTPAQDSALENAAQDGSYSSFISASGYILAVSYPVLALSTGVRAVYQLFFKEGVTDILPPLLSLTAALCYLVATIGFAYRRKWTWWLSMITLAIETTFTVVVGTLSFTHPGLIGHTAWSYFGRDYGWFPFFQPLLGLAWLLWPATMRMYGIRGEDSATNAADATPTENPS